MTGVALTVKHRRSEALSLLLSHSMECIEWLACASDTDVTSESKGTIGVRHDDVGQPHPETYYSVSLSDAVSGG